MNEPFLLSNLIELQELDNEIFKLISEKSEGTTVKELKTHEIEFKKLQSDKQNIENELQLYFDAKNHIEKSISESQLKIDTINEKLNTNLDASELQNYNLQKQNFEKNLLDYEKSLNELNEENSDELERINKIDQSLEDLKPTLLSLSKTLCSENSGIPIPLNSALWCAAKEFNLSLTVSIFAKSPKRIARRPTLSSYAGPIPRPVVPIFLAFAEISRALSRF